MRPRHPRPPLFPGLQPVYRGANWNNDANKGAWYLNGNNDFSNWNYNIGGRLGYLHRQTKNIASAILPEWGNSRKERA